jgi:dTDP-glucose 4,6-dehydratase
MKTAMITGGLGFIGSELAFQINQLPDWKVIILDKMGYASNIENINGRDYGTVSTRPKVYECDIAEPGYVAQHARYESPDIIYHLAAESHVDNSISSPRPFVNNNILAMTSLLEDVREYMGTRQCPLGFKVVNISTDEVYGSIPKGKYASWLSPLNPSSPYSASKAACDLLAHAYKTTWNIPIYTTHCTNNFGPYQHDEKLIPTLIRNAVEGRPFPLYGEGKNIRDWVPVEVHARALLEYMQPPNKTFYPHQIASGVELSNLDLCFKLAEVLKRKLPNYHNMEIEFIEDRLGHDYRYALVGGGGETEAWTEYFENTVDWYVNEYSN